MSGSIRPALPALLELRGVSKRFGGLQAVEDVSIRVAPREIVGVMGPNGAGKSTLLDLIAGHQPVTAGRVFFDGHDLTRLTQFRRVRAGLVRVVQHAVHLEGLSAEENVALGSAAPAARRGWLARLRSKRGRSLPPPARHHLRTVGLEDCAGEVPAALSHWQRRLLAVARALASEPKLLLLDEPLAGLSDTEIDDFARLVHGLRERAGTTFVVVEHRIDALLRLCDRIVVLHRGAKIADDVPARITANRQVRDVYLGDDPWHC